MMTTMVPQGEADGEREAAGAASENTLIINYLPSDVTEVELRVRSQAASHERTWWYIV